MAFDENHPLPRCGGRLSIEEATDGMNAAVENARRLVRDAEMLFDSGSYATASSIAILAIEEAGKVSIIRALLTVNDDQIKSFWKDYRSHRAKNVAWILPDLVSRGARTLWGMREAANVMGEHTGILDSLKQLGFYTDFVGKRNWSRPTDVVDEELADTILSIARIAASKRAVSIQENELWVKHLGPSSKYGMTKNGLSEFFSEAVKLGIVSVDDNDAQKFIFGGASVVEE